MRTAKVTIDINALHYNVATIKKLAPQSKMMVMLKANAYGHGIEVCTLALLDNDNVAGVGVATMEEALTVRRLGWHKKIVIIEGIFSFAEWQTAIKYEIQVFIHNHQQLNWAITSIADDSSPTNIVWLKFNTGMNRLGFQTNEIVEIAKRLHLAGYQQILTSHFANADDKEHPLNKHQGTLFSSTLEKLKENVCRNIQGSLCNSAATVNFPMWHYDWVRAGIMVYGSSPVNDRSADQLNIKEVMTLSCKVMAIQSIKLGETVGYGSRWAAEKDSTIAILSIGYGDGYPRMIDDKAFVIVKGTQDWTCPIIGRVAMDMIVIDISHVNNNQILPLIKINDDVVMWGSKPHIDTVANTANTISYELLCRLTDRPHRVLVS